LRTGSIPSLARPLGLSLREAEIMTLIAEGHSNREIAAQLVLAPLKENPPAGLVQCVSAGKVASSESSIASRRCL